MSRPAAVPAPAQAFVSAAETAAGRFSYLIVALFANDGVENSSSQILAVSPEIFFSSYDLPVTLSVQPNLGTGKNAL